jgi:hypothetical protein
VGGEFAGVFLFLLPGSESLDLLIYINFHFHVASCVCPASFPPLNDFGPF